MKPSPVIQDVLMAELRFLEKMGSVLVKLDTADSAVHKSKVNIIYNDVFILG